jgi:phage shock protein PspC (stress-responsive transcriptional regulator)
VSIGATSLEADRAASAELAAEQPWVVAGAAAAIAGRLRIRAGWVRTFLVLVSFAKFWPVLGLYALAALVVPHAGRRLPGGANLVGLLRLATVAAAVALTPVVSLDPSGILGQGPDAWVPVGGALLAGIAVFAASGRTASAAPAGEDRRIAASALPGVGLAAVVAIVVLLWPSVRADIVLSLGLVAAGAGVAALGDRLRATTAVVPLALLAFLAVVLVGSNTPLRGGVGDLSVAPRGSPAALTYRRAIGNLTVNLRGLRRGGPSVVKVVASVGIGRLRILVPDAATGTVDIRIGGGTEVDSYAGLPRGGFLLHRTAALRSLGGGRPQNPDRTVRLFITASVGRGCLEVLDPPYATGGC